MARFRESLEVDAIETIDKACPVCAQDVKGNDTYLFFCKKCNILFKREELFLENPERLRGIVEKKIIEKYESEKDKIRLDEKLLPLKHLKVQRLKNHDAEKSHTHIIKYVASKSSNKLHLENCPFAKNIKKSNREQFHSLNDAKKHKSYKYCKCID
ncbi:MAG: hypothetical protein ACP5NV_05985 [Candidatus Woesearchaeota archaeon]